MSGCRNRKSCQWSGYGKVKRWWGSVLNEDKKPEQVEFDVMAESLDKKYLLVGECKWTIRRMVNS